MTRNELDAESYRSSHAKPGYGHQYSRVYQQGYYSHQWDLLERPLLRNLLQTRKDNGADQLLDFACGTGRILSECEQVFEHVVGVDVSEAMLEVARANCQSQSILCMDITNTPLEQKFDVITAFRFFVNAEPSLRESALESLHYSLADNGMLIANIHQNSRSPLGWAYRFRNFLSGRTKANVLSHPEFCSLLRSKGFEVCETHWYSYYPRIGWLFGGLSGKLMMPIENLCKFLHIPASLSQCFIVVAKKAPLV